MKIFAAIIVLIFNYTFTVFLMDVLKMRIPRAEFHGITLNFVECRIAHKAESPYFCLKRRISTLKKLKFSYNSAFWSEIRTFCFTLHSKNFQNYFMEFRPWNPLFRHTLIDLIKTFKRISNQTLIWKWFKFLKKLW